MGAPQLTDLAQTAGLTVDVTPQDPGGDLFVVGIWERAGAGIPTHTLQSGFTELFSQPLDDGSEDGRLSVAYIVYNDTATHTMQPYTTSGSDTVRISYFQILAGSFSLPVLPTAAGVSATTNAAPNPPSVAGLTGDYMILVFSGWRLSASTAVTITAPTNYTIGSGTVGGSDIEFGTAYRELLGLSAATEDPGAWSDDVAPTGTASVTVAILGTPDSDSTPSLGCS